jgi:hypothetical protein
VKTAYGLCVGGLHGQRKKKTSEDASRYRRDKARNAVFFGATGIRLSRNLDFLLLFDQAKRRTK